MIFVHFCALFVFSSFPNPQTRPKLITQFFVRCDHLNSDCTFALFELPGEQVVIAIRGTRTMSQLFFETMSAFIPDTSFHGLGEPKMKHTRVQNSPKTGKVYVLFYEDDSAFSNFHPAKFEAATVKKLVNSEKFQEEETLKWNCSEQYFMYHKALLVNDQNAAKFIHDSKYPMPMKMAGRKLNMTRNDLEKWSEKSREVMYQACLAKFSQNLELRKLLFRTKGMILVEASGNDAIWGIGIWKEDPRAQNEDSWHGTNWLGIILDKIREELWDKPEFKNEKEEIEKENVETRIMFLEALKDIDNNFENSFIST
ncbi:hypothetical protein L3Y34_009879 [Caenorhabditis briggsae]|uniref:NADAR domain-containing protein n=1 Tax=Caenorhabditis briggsae TaxID=6238 RepID=A0AAE9A6E9_CAEBR|nr:hypothetical protein L3Y34_009879 [Caenorhabditis briggsae]